LTVLSNDRSINMHITYLSFGQMSGCDTILWVVTFQHSLFLSSLKIILSTAFYTASVV
jgi:hypothetical protein